MQRRQALKKTNWILASAIFGPSLMTAIQSCATDKAIPDELLVLNPTQLKLTAAIADTILPRTESPSASDVKVPQFLDLLLNDVLNEDAQKHLIDGLEHFNSDCHAATGKLFENLSAENRNKYLEPIDKQVMGQDYSDDIPFYFTFKKLCLNIYYSTEEGIKQNLDYRPIPGSYQSDVDLSSNRLLEVGNNM